MTIAPALIDELLPQFDEFERHEILVSAAAGSSGSTGA